ncbi:FUSC family protein [Yersinia pestis]|nr:putative membrane protein [Yersinia pestis biovar Microtus str. 91001]AYW85620.1 FUSC family protein [Yersinia pestis]EDM39834.1 putative membrane protein [Yersinia pestis CA88-4125]KPD88465.1 fusaric acid resistance protein [Yersinia pestis subsp. microtus bv. Caucasica]OUY15952.1 FUSC family protein [Yersinia pestis subsp. microtus bv. Altaica]OVY77345.1 FUSC family protein [Yersinia pestis subsp. microtus bv. Xilingolensis]OVY86897.1 FUSC family protein [Yersinia pestis subsp. microtus]
MIYGIPESAISCYLIIFVMKPDGVESMVMAVAITILVSLVVGLVFLLIHFTLEAAPLRMAALIVSSFLFLYLGSASKLGPVGSIIALVIAYVMTLLSNIPMGEVATRGLLYAWLMAVSPMLLIIGFNLFFGRAPQTLLRASLAERLSTVAETLRYPNAANMARVGEQLQEGQHEHQQRALFVRIFHLRPSAEAAWLESAVKSSYRLLLVTSALPPTSPEAVRLELAAYCSDAAQAIASGDLAAPPHFAIEDTSDEINEIRNALIALANADNGQDLDAPKSSFFAADALTNPVHQQFALKTTAAALICYLIYTALDWQDIHTAMITCYVAALGTTGETVHKLVLRIIGCLIGALMGVLSIIFIIPHMSDIGQLMALVFGCILVAAWVSCGSERIAYAGVQVGLAFLLTVLQGFGPSTDMGVALDRVLGILLGNLVVYLIFSRLWPVAITDAVHVHISRALKGLTNLAALSPDARPAALREATTVEAEITKAQEELALIPFEPVQFRPSRKECARLQAILAEMGKLCPVLFLPTEKSASDVEQLRQLSAGSDAMTLSDEQGQNSGSLRQELSPINLTIQQRIKRLEELLGI